MAALHAPPQRLWGHENTHGYCKKSLSYSHIQYTYRMQATRAAQAKLQLRTSSRQPVHVAGSRLTARCIPVDGCSTSGRAAEEDSKLGPVQSHASASAALQALSRRGVIMALVATGALMMGPGYASANEPGKLPKGTRGTSPDLSLRFLMACTHPQQLQQARHAHCDCCRVSLAGRAHG